MEDSYIPFVPTTLTEALHRKTKYCPHVHQKHAGKSMKALAESEYINFNEDEKLHCIVLQTKVADNLLNNINEDIKDIKFNKEDPCYPYFIPLIDQPIKWRFECLPPVFNSENDVRSIFDTIFVRPAIAGIQIMKDTTSQNSVTIDLTRIKSYPNYQETFYASGIIQDLHVTPDGALYKKSKDEELVTLCTTELKLDGLFSYCELDSLLNSTNNKQTTQTAIPFKYPAEEDITAPDVLCRLIVQVYSQMISGKNNFALLTSFKTTYFVYKKKINNFNILYFSEGVNSFKLCPLTILAWFLFSMKSEPPSSSLFEEPDMSCVESWFSYYKENKSRISHLDIPSGPLKEEFGFFKENRTNLNWGNYYNQSVKEMGVGNTETKKARGKSAGPDDNAYKSTHSGPLPPRNILNRKAKDKISYGE